MQDKYLQKRILEQTLFSIQLREKLSYQIRISVNFKILKISPIPALSQYADDRDLPLLQKTQTGMHQQKPPLKVYLHITAKSMKLHPSKTHSYNNLSEGEGKHHNTSKRREKKRDIISSLMKKAALQSTCLNEQTNEWILAQLMRA